MTKSIVLWALCMLALFMTNAQEEQQQQQLCKSGKWLSRDDILASVQPGDIVAVRPNSEALPRFVIHVGNGRVVKQVVQNFVTKFAIGPLIDMMMLMTGKAEACVSNPLDSELFPNSSAIAEERDGMVERALSEVGKVVPPTTENATELHLATYARYGNFNQTWIEKAINGSSMMFLEQIHGGSLHFKTLLDGWFGDFTQKLVDGSMDLLKGSSVELGKKSSLDLAKQQSLAGTSIGTSLGG